MKKVLITGAQGFLGKNFSESWKRKFSLFLPSIEELDVLDEKAVEAYLKKHNFDAVVHCAAVGVSRKDNTSNAALLNLKMFSNLARCSEYYNRMIFIGSGAEYDKRRDLIKVKEEEFGKSVPADPYGFSKYLCTLLIKKIPNIVNLRAFAVFGKYEDYETRFISNTICKSLLGLPVVINQDVRFDYFSVSDLARVAEHFVTHEFKRQFYNVGLGQGITLTEIVKKIEAISGKKMEVKIKKPGMNKEYTCDNSRLLSEIPNFVFTPFDEALASLYNWYTNNMEKIEKTKLFFDA